jgi:hypothetical protein
LLAGYVPLTLYISSIFFTVKNFREHPTIVRMTPLFDTFYFSLDPLFLQAFVAVHSIGRCGLEAGFTVSVQYHFWGVRLYLQYTDLKA